MRFKVLLLFLLLNPGYSHWGPTPPTSPTSLSYSPPTTPSYSPPTTQSYSLSSPLYSPSSSITEQQQDTSTIIVTEMSSTISSPSSKGTDDLGCSLDDEGKPPRPRIILLGETGVGKSTFGNRLFKGYKDTVGSSPEMKSIVQEGSNLEKSKSGEFGVGHGMLSHTNETVWRLGKWLGDPAGQCITIIDTPGLQDTENRSCLFTREIGEAVDKLGEIDAFFLVFKGVTTRLTPVVREQLNIFQQLFGKDFWRRTIIQNTFWPHDKKARRRREKNKRTEETVRKNWLDVLGKEMDIPHTGSLPVVFIDSVIEDGFAEPIEIQRFKEETDKTIEFIITDNPFRCNESSCRSSSYTSGVPLSLNSEAEYARTHDSIRFLWKIWFNEDCGRSQRGVLRSYEMRKDNKTIYIMREIEIVQNAFEKKGTETKYFPRNSLPVVEDECGKLHTKEEDCDHEKSKFKTVALTLQNIGEDSFGTYSIKNSIGESEPVTLLQTVDGSWSSWTSWSSCSKTCLSELDGFAPGRKTRTRRCDSPKPQNGGKQCKGEETETTHCINNFCEGQWQKWTPWSSCSKSCKETGSPAGVRNRKRKCSELSCKDGGEVETEDCNTHNCPREAVLGSWSKWRCNSNCYRPGEKLYRGHRETRERTCEDFEDNPDPNQKCTNIETIQAREGCSNFAECPPLRKLIIKAGSGYYDGTSDNIQIIMENKRGENCTTDYINDNKYGFSLADANSEISLDALINPLAALALGDCAAGLFRPDEELWLKIDITRSGWNAHYDGYAISRIYAEFDRGRDNDYNTEWGWINRNPVLCDGCSGEGQVFNLRRV